MSKVSVRIAAELTGKSRDTINVATNDGTLSFTKNARGHKEIDVSELQRVFPLIKLPEDIGSHATPVRSGPKPSDADAREDLTRLLERLKHREEINETQRIERERERQQLVDEIESLRRTLERVQEQHNKALLMVTDQRSARDDSLEDIQAQLAEQGARMEKLLSEAKSESRRSTIEELKSLPWWRLALGGKLSA